MTPEVLVYVVVSLSALFLMVGHYHVKRNDVCCTRGAVRMRPDHSGRDGPGPNMRGASSANRGRGTFSSRDGGRPAVMSDQVSHTYFISALIANSYLFSVFICT